MTVIDYGVGNLGSIANMFRKVGVDARIVSTEDEILGADALALPGVGSFDRGMQNLESSGLLRSLEKAVLDKETPLLAICLGMQLLTKGSEEGARPGLGWVDASTRRFSPPDPRVKVPHMGWGRVDVRKPSPLFSGIEDPQFYFLHSFYVECHQDDSLSSATYADVTFDAALGRGNIFGVQFHPEKSHRFGMQLFRNFAALAK